KNQVRHEGAENVWIDLFDDFESVLEAYALDLEVVPYEAELFFKGHLLPVGSFEGAPEQGAQPRDDVLVTFGLFVGERADGVQRIEEEVVVDLPPERRQAGVGKLGLEARRLGFETGGVGL